MKKKNIATIQTCIGETKAGLVWKSETIVVDANLYEEMAKFTRAEKALTQKDRRNGVRYIDTNKTLVEGNYDDVGLVDEYEIVRRVLADLPDKYKEVLLLKFYDQKNFSQISKELHIDRETVRRRYDKGLAILKPQLEKLLDMLPNVRMENGCKDIVPFEAITNILTEQIL